MYLPDTTGVKRLISRALLLTALLWLPLGVGADVTLEGKTVPEWIRAMVDSAQTTPYQGTFNFQQAGLPLTRFEVLRHQIDGIPYERLRHIKEPVREMVRHGDMVTFTVLKGDDFIQTVGSFVPTVFDNEFSRLFTTLPDHYDAVFAGSRKIAKRSAVGIHVAPKDKHRYGYRIWLDLDSALMLSFEMLDTSQRVLESFEFETFTLNTEPEVIASYEQVQHDQIRMRIRPQRRSLTPIAAPVAEYKSWRFGWLPEGFALVSRHSKQTVRPGSTTALHSLVYSDGLAVFSIFIEMLPNMRVHEQLKCHGGTTTAVRWTKDAADISHMVTLVGEIPEKTALRIAEAVRHYLTNQRRTTNSVTAARQSNC